MGQESSTYLIIFIRHSLLHRISRFTVSFPTSDQQRHMQEQMDNLTAQMAANFHDQPPP